MDEIDGSLLEGGGQILRVAITLSALRKIPVRISNIRGGRSKPGLMEQHLKGVELVRDICSAGTKGVSLGSKEIEFAPEGLAGGSYRAAVKTAGSICLLMQVALPCTLFAQGPTTLYLKGGTNAEMAPQIDYMVEVFRPNLEKFGATFDFNLLRRGYFPKGGGEVVINVNPVGDLKPVDITKQGSIKSLYGWSFTAGVLPIKMAHAMAEGAVEVLRKIGKVDIERYKEDRNVAPDNCSGIILVAETDSQCFLGGSALGRKGESAEETGKKAAQELLKSIEDGACVDQHCQDQLIIFMALAKGPSQIRVGDVSLHTKTAIFVAEKLLKNVHFEIVPDGTTNIIKCTGS
ncbi:unnamed protein product [Phyllotreta striolata]|uniref:RNA 3'-terminal phosphate cyclase n=1 Tax=Phyllotreta striolata TaxID=444603 RepID=A0A9N9XSV9_PHYSR|nr:unnamed protein product [Phyllotreta striolata]